VPIYSRRYALWTRLYKRMLLEPTPADPVTPSVSEVVVPVIQADRILTTPKAAQAVSNLTASAGTYVAAFTVPAGEEWTLILYERPSTTGTTQYGVSIGGNEVYLEKEGTDESIHNVRDIILSEGDSLGLWTTGNGADSARYSYLVYNTVDLTT